MGLQNVQDESNEKLNQTTQHLEIYKHLENIVLQGGNRKTIVLNKPFEWKIIKFSIRLFQMYTNLYILRSKSNSPHFAFMWGDAIGSTTTWKYQYVAEVEILNPTNSGLEIHFKKVGFYTFSSGFPPSTWTTKNNHSNYQIESILLE